MGTAASDRRRRTTSDAANPNGLFNGFGRSLIPAVARRPLQSISIEDCLKTSRGTARHNIPICPGVYGWLNAQGMLLYVGKSKSLRHRLVSYFAGETSDPKMGKIRRQSKTLIWEPISHELLALIREQELIDRFRPPLNVEGKPERRQPGFVCIDTSQAPKAFFSREVPRRAAHAFGPYAGRAQLSETVTSLNYVFGLRDCPDKTKMQFNNQLRLFHDTTNAQCLRFELGSCLGPCAAACSRETYQENVDTLVSFLEGKNPGIIKQLQARMKQAAEKLAFERATVLRDQLNHLSWLSRRIRQLQNAREKLNGLLSLPGFDHQTIWLEFTSGLLQRCLDEPPKERRIHANGSGSRDRVPVPRTNLEINLLLLMATWIKKRPDYFESIEPDSTPESAPVDWNSERVCA